MAGEQGRPLGGKSQTQDAGGLFSASIQFQHRDKATLCTSSCEPSPFGEGSANGHSLGPWLSTHLPATPSHHLGWGFPRPGGRFASLPEVSRCRVESPGLASFPASASAKLFLASRGAGRTAGSAARVNFCGSRMSRTEKEILWWEGAALAPPSCHASMPAAHRPEAGGAGSGMAALWLAFGCGRAAALQPVGGSGRPSGSGEGPAEAGLGESRRGAAPGLALARPRPPPRAERARSGPETALHRAGAARLGSGAPA